MAVATAGAEGEMFVTGILELLRRRLVPMARPSAGIGTNNPYRTTDQLNAALARIQTTDELRRWYAGILNRQVGTSQENFEDIVSCGDTNNFILKYLSFGRIEEGRYGDNGKEVHFWRETSHYDGYDYVSGDVVLKRLKSKPIPHVATMMSMGDSHVVTLANTGSGWCFYQSNVGSRRWLTDGQCFTISDRLNGGMGRGQKQLIDLKADGLATLIATMTNGKNHQSLFYGTRAITRWKLRLYSLDGTQINMSR